MADTSFLIMIDTPSIKRFVFGTDALKEIRGASALLDYLNQVETERHLHRSLDKARIEKIYANGGSAQFLAHGSDHTAVRDACLSLVKSIRERTAGEVQIVYGIAPLENDVSYKEAVRDAQFRIRCQREFATCHRSAALTPLMMECHSASHLPAWRPSIMEGEDEQMLSEASHRKREQADRRGNSLWDGWMQYLEEDGPWPAAERWNQLRCESLSDIGGYSGSKRNYIGVVYADGNSMGKMVQALDHPDKCRHFSQIVDESIREACYSALTAVSRKAVEQVRECVETSSQSLPALPADILLLGGDDLLVALPADRALDFTLQVTEKFERLTRERIAALEAPEVKQFFRDKLGNQGFTISCGVAIVKSAYPFYLSLDLAESLLKTAKQGGGSVQPTERERTRTGIDFHVVSGSNSYDLEDVRENDLKQGTKHARTLRPLPRNQLQKLRDSVRILRDARFPRSKLHELHEAALHSRANQAEWLMRDVFTRCRYTKEQPHRYALWKALENLYPAKEGLSPEIFPWFAEGERYVLGMVDLAEAYDLFPSTEQVP